MSEEINTKVPSNNLSESNQTKHSSVNESETNQTEQFTNKEVIKQKTNDQQTNDQQQTNEQEEEREHVVGKKILPLFGLNNLGNTCFINAATQLLLSIDDLVNLIQDENIWLPSLEKLCDNKNKEEVFNICSSFVFISLYKLMKLGGSFGSKSPLEFIRLVLLKSQNKGITIGTQGDAHEFITIALDLINKELIDAKTNKSYISEFIGFENEKTIECLLCREKNEAKQDDLILPLYLEDGNTIQELINNYYDKATRVDYTCEKNKEQTEAEIKNITEFNQKYIILHLMRFKIKGTSYVKDNKIIDINETIKVKDVEYKVKSIVCHSGGLNGGHYFNYSRREDKWYCFNDSSVSEQNNMDFLKSCSNGLGYVLLYEKV